MKERTLAAVLMLSTVKAALRAADITTQPTPPPTRAANTSGATRSHDPSRMILCNGKYYVYSTGGGMKYSTDQVNWVAGPSPFAGFAPAATQPTTRPMRGSGRGGTPPSVKAIVP